MRKNELLEVTLKLALKVITYCELLEIDRKYVIARQLLKSGTSIGANSREAQGAESKADYCLVLCEKSVSYRNPPQELKDHLSSSLRLLGKIISSSKN